MFIPANEIKVGDKCIAIKEIECLAGMFTVGTPVTVTGIGDRGYDLVDDLGNVITECGWNCIKRDEFCSREYVSARCPLPGWDYEDVKRGDKVG